MESKDAIIARLKQELAEASETILSLIEDIKELKGGKK